AETTSFAGGFQLIPVGGGAPMPLRHPRRGARRTSAINDKFASRDCQSPLRGKKRDELRNLFGPVGSPQWNTAKHLHQFLPCRRVVTVILLGHAFDHPGRGIRFDEARGHGNDSDPLGLTSRASSLRTWTRLQRFTLLTFSEPLGLMSWIAWLTSTASN